MIPIRLPDWYADHIGGTQNRRKRPIAKRPRANIEHKFQVALVSAARKANPNIVLRAIPNGGARNVRVAVKLKAEGVTRGTPDLFCFIPGVGVGFLELKAPKGRLTAEQEAFRDECHAHGIQWMHAADFDTAWGVLAGWGVVPSEVEHTLVESATADDSTERPPQTSRLTPSHSTTQTP